MKTAGLRQARQNFSALLEEVRKGREIEITDRGRPVARLVPAQAKRSPPFRSRRAFRLTMPKLDPPISRTVLSEREDRS